MDAGRGRTVEFAPLYAHAAKRDYFRPERVINETQATRLKPIFLLRQTHKFGRLINLITDQLTRCSRSIVRNRESCCLFYLWAIIWNYRPPLTHIMRYKSANSNFFFAIAFIRITVLLYILPRTPVYMSKSCGSYSAGKETIFFAIKLTLSFTSYFLLLDFCIT